MKRTRTTQLIAVERVERDPAGAGREELDADLAMLYGVTTGNLNKAFKRNLRRFPPDFMFQLTDEETAALIFQSGRPKSAVDDGTTPMPSPSRAWRCFPTQMRSIKATV